MPECLKKKRGGGSLLCSPVRNSVRATWRIAMGIGIENWGMREWTKTVPESKYEVVITPRAGADGSKVKRTLQE